MAKVAFKQGSGQCPVLFLENVFDKIPDNHLARLVNEVVDSLDISDIITLYKGGGCSAYHSRMVLKVLLAYTIRFGGFARKISSFE